MQNLALVKSTYFAWFQSNHFPVKTYVSTYLVGNVNSGFSVSTRSSSLLGNVTRLLVRLSVLPGTRYPQPCLRVWYSGNPSQVMRSSMGAIWHWGLMFTGPSFHSSLSDGPIHRDRYHLKIRSKNVFCLHCLWKTPLAGAMSWIAHVRYVFVSWFLLDQGRPRGESTSLPSSW